MFNTERFCNSILLGMTFCLISCEAFVDEMRIRSDPNTIVKPDWNELEAIEKAEGTYLGDEPVQVIQPPPVVKVQEANPGMRRIEKNYSPIVSPAIRPQAMIPQAMVPEASASYANPQPRPGSAYPLFRRCVLCRAGAISSGIAPIWLQVASSSSSPV